MTKLDMLPIPTPPTTSDYVASKPDPDDLDELSHRARGWLRTLDASRTILVNVTETQPD